MDKIKFLELLKETMGEQPVSLSGTDRVADLQGWDSLAILQFIVMSETYFGTVTTPEDIEKCATVDDLFHLCAPNVVEATNVCSTSVS